MHDSNKYYELSKFAKTFNYGNILEEVKDYFGYIHDKDEMDDIALKLQICMKSSKPMYLHGYVISSALYKYLSDHSGLDDIVILETGTARGFSSVVMASVMNLKNMNGTIYTTDHNDRFDNCLKASQLKRKITLEECVEEWKDLVQKYITFKKGDSNKILNSLDTSLSRIHFAFLDGAHFYDYLKKELDFVASKQQVGDVIVCDDYTEKQFPGICKAIDEFLKKGNYEHRVFYGDDGTKKRGYVYMRRLH